MKLEIRNMGVTFESNEEEMVLTGRVNDLGWSKLLTTKTKRFYEKIGKGVFTRAIEKATESNNPIDLLGGHKGEFLLASTQNGSLTLEEREDGLYMKATIVDTDYGRRFYELAKAGLYQEMSFGFKINEERWERNQDKTFNRYVDDLELFECSIVRVGAYNNTNVQLQARGLDIIDDPDLPTELREDEVEQEGTEVAEQKPSDEVKSEINIDEIINKAVNVATEKIKQEYEVIINEMKKEEVKEEEETKVDVTKYLDNIKKLQQMKGDTEE